MERTSPKRIRIDGCNAVVLEAEQVNEQLILAEGLAERAKVSVKEAGDREKIEKLAAADREKNDMLAAAAEKTDSERAAAQRAQVSVKEAAHREKIGMLAAADRKRAEKTDSKRAEHEAAQRAQISVKEAADRDKIEMLAAADRKRAEKTDSKRAEHEAACVTINDEEAQTKRIKIDAEEGEKSCGAEGCGKRNHGQFKSRSREAMRQHCGTQKHKVFNSAKCPFVICTAV